MEFRITNWSVFCSSFSRAYPSSERRRGTVTDLKAERKGPITRLSEELSWVKASAFEARSPGEGTRPTTPVAGDFKPQTPSFREIPNFKRSDSAFLLPCRSCRSLARLREQGIPIDMALLMELSQDLKKALAKHLLCVTKYKHGNELGC